MIRPALLAGAWYPREEAACRAAVLAHCAGADADAGADAERAVGAIAPHAGWAFSGDCAGAALGALGARSPGATLAVVFGSHRGPEGPNTVFLGDAWDTPLGAIPGATDLAEALASTADLHEEPVRPARADNAVELLLPFVRHLFPDARLLMLGVAAHRGAAEIGRRVGQLARERAEAAVFIGSTDLTHYGPNYDFTPVGVGEPAERWVQENDRGYLERLVSDRPLDALDHALDHRSACCPGAALATFEAVRANAGVVTPRLVSHTSSLAVRRDASFVGYGSLLL